MRKARRVCVIDVRRIEPVELDDVIRRHVCVGNEPVSDAQRHCKEAHLTVAIEPRHGVDVEVVIVIVRYEHHVDRRHISVDLLAVCCQLVEALRSDALHRAAAVAEDRIRQHVEAVDLMSDIDQFKNQKRK